MDSSYKPAMEFGGAAPTIASSSLASYSSSTSTSLPFVPGNLVDTKAGNIVDICIVTDCTRTVVYPNKEILQVDVVVIFYY